MEEFNVKIKWNNPDKELKFDHYSRNHTVYFGGEQTLKNSSAVSYKGDPNASNPEELLLSALSSCHMLTFLAIASKSGYVVASYFDEAKCYLEKNSENKMTVSKIVLQPKIIFTGDKVPDNEKIKSMHDKAHHNCFIANSINCEVAIISNEV
jgi:organic hydroperoxide reductase OsmC/OhrA